jgi:hypothetical protein
VRPGCLPSGIAVGLTLTGPTQRETIERALEVGGFDAVQATWNLLEGGATSALAAARAAGVGMIIKEALANGRLTARGDVPLLARAAPSVGRYARCGRAGGRPGPALGARELEFPEELWYRLEPLREDSVAYWKTRAALAWN